MDSRRVQKAPRRWYVLTARPHGKEQVMSTNVLSVVASPKTVLTTLSRALLQEHVTDTFGMCVASSCRDSAALWPCDIYKLARRAQGSQLRIGMRVAPGSWYCVSCPECGHGLGDPSTVATRHTTETAHPVVCGLPWPA